jgi:hypothetical protein
MKKVTTVLLLLFAFIVVLTGCDNHGNYSFLYNGKKCEIVKEKMTWADAAMYAVKKGAHLVEIKDAAKQNAIYNALINEGGVSATYTKVKDGGGVAYIWIGATDRSHRGVWMWDGENNGQGQNFWNGEGAHGRGNGAPVNKAYTNWGGSSTGKPNEPDNSNGNQTAAAMGLADWPKESGSLGHAGEWNDINENNQLYFVIEYGK